jgi:hypothetical protein
LGNLYFILGITALFMSCKYEEIYFPGVNEFLLTTQNSYTPEEVYQMEADILI